MKASRIIKTGFVILSLLYIIIQLVSRSISDETRIEIAGIQTENIIAEYSLASDTKLLITQSNAVIEIYEVIYTDTSIVMPRLYRVSSHYQLNTEFKEFEVTKAGKANVISDSPEFLHINFLRYNNINAVEEHGLRTVVVSSDYTNYITESDIIDIGNGLFLISYEQIS